MLGKITHKLRRWSGRFRRRDRIFLLSHMRANTSLFGHILGSNPHIEGYYELHESYRQPSDLAHAKNKYYRSHCPKNGATYLFDKLLHNHHMLNASLLGEQDKLVFMIREPEATVKSILKIFADKPESQWADQESAERYYVERLQALAHLSSVFKGRYLFLKSEDLILDTEHTLQALTRFLELSTPLSERYERFSKTGRRGFGDSSSNITTGKIVKDKKAGDASIQVATECHETYQATLETLAENAYRP